MRQDCLVYFFLLFYVVLVRFQDARLVRTPALCLNLLPLLLERPVFRGKYPAIKAVRLLVSNQFAVSHAHRHVQGLVVCERLWVALVLNVLALVD